MRRCAVAPGYNGGGGGGWNCGGWPGGGLIRTTEAIPTRNYIEQYNNKEPPNS